MLRTSSRGYSALLTYSTAIIPDVQPDLPASFTFISPGYFHNLRSSLIILPCQHTPLYVQAYMSSHTTQNQQDTAQNQSSSTGSRSRNLLLISIVTAFLAFTIALLLGSPSNTAAIRRFWPFSSASRSILNPQAGRATVASTRTVSTNPTQSLQGDRKAETKMGKTPVYFLSHGGVCSVSLYYKSMCILIVTSQA